MRNAFGELAAIPIRNALEVLDSIARQPGDHHEILIVALSKLVYTSAETQGIDPSEAVRKAMGSIAEIHASKAN